MAMNFASPGLPMMALYPQSKQVYGCGEAKLSITLKVIGNVHRILSLMDLSGTKTLKHPKTLNGTI
jgi:hypothetical protein